MRFRSPTLRRAATEARARSYLALPRRIELAFAGGLLAVFEVVEHLYQNIVALRTDSAASDALDALDAQLPQLLGRAPLLYQRMAMAVRVENLETVRKALGLYPGGEAAVERAILEGRERTIQLVEDAARDYAADVRAVFEDPMSFSMTVEELTEALLARGRITRARAELIAVDQVNKLNCAINRARQEAAGCTHYVYLTQQDDRVRPRHREHDNKVFAWNNPPDSGHPGTEPRCRCLSVGILPLL